MVLFVIPCGYSLHIYSEKRGQSVAVVLVKKFLIYFLFFLGGFYFRHALILHFCNGNILLKYTTLLMILIG